jgi:hypothetical protein
MPELPLNDDQWNALVGHLDSSVKRQVIEHLGQLDFLHARPGANRAEIA